LHGVPIAIKDIFDYAGHPTRAGSAALTDRNPSISAHAVRRLEAAGMIVLGKTQMVEFAFGGWGTNPVQGTPWNPWDLETHRVPGGSSSGSAVAVAAGLAPAALGTDTGGSIRTPAAWCGVIGLKTSSGLIGRHGVVPLSPTHDTVGPLARSVRDAALLLEALAGIDPLDSTTQHAPAISPLAGLEQGVEGLRIGILREADLRDVDADIRRLLQTALKDLEELGAHLEEIALPLSMEDYARAGGDIMSAESYAHLGRYAEPSDSPVDPVIRERILRGRDVTASMYILLLEARQLARVEFLAALDRLDAFVAPACPRTAVPVDQVDETVAPNMFGRFVNFLDLASLSIPIGLTNGGLPAGLQIVTRRYGDALALRIGRTLERARGTLVLRPPGL
jgi:aspartyl-tRNA(Asn)/glutamyl-tRNA(Gln) amidotransferase subunit A